MATPRYQPLSPFPEMGWNYLGPQDLYAFLGAVNQRPDQLQLNPQATHVAWRQSPFYETAAIIRAVDQSFQPNGLTVWFIGHQGRQLGADPSRQRNRADPPVRTELC